MRISGDCSDWSVLGREGRPIEIGLKILRNWLEQGQLFDHEIYLQGEVLDCIRHIGASRERPRPMPSVAGCIEPALSFQPHIFPARPAPGFDRRVSSDNAKTYMLHHEHLYELLDDWASNLAWSFRSRTKTGWFDPFWSDQCGDYATFFCAAAFTAVSASLLRVASVWLSSFNVASSSGTASL